MELYFLGAAGEVGRSCVLLSTDQNIVLDCGLKIHNKKDPHLYPQPPPLPVDVAVISHPHLDHIGFLPSLFEHHTPRVIATPPTKEIGELLLLDSAKIIIEEYGTLPYKRSSHRKAMQSFRLQGYHQKAVVGDSSIILFDAGHIPGSAQVLVEYNEKKLLYSGDFKLSPTRMHKPAEIVEDVDILVIESTYANRDHPNRQDLEIQLVQRAKEVISNGGNLLLPAFAVGRTQELISILKSHDKDLPIWVDGMGVEASRIIAEYPSYIKDPHNFRKYMNTVNIVRNNKDRMRVLKEPCVIIATAGMLQGGPALGYLLSLNEASEVIFTGFCVEGTNGHNLLQYGYVEKDGEEIRPSVPISYLDFSAHASRSELFEYVEKLNPSKIFCIHGDLNNCIQFAEELKLEGFDAHAPSMGEKIELD
jgi:putative mRNA 3-end processing factor